MFSPPGGLPGLNAQGLHVGGDIGDGGLGWCVHELDPVVGLSGATLASVTERQRRQAQFRQKGIMFPHRGNNSLCIFYQIDLHRPQTDGFPRLRRTDVEREMFRLNSFSSISFISTRRGKHSSSLRYRYVKTISSRGSWPPARRGTAPPNVTSPLS